MGLFDWVPRTTLTDSIGSATKTWLKGWFGDVFVSGSITDGEDSVTVTQIQALIDAPAGTGTVTSVDVSGGTTGLTASGGPVTESGTLTLGGTLAVANGGTAGTTVLAAQNSLRITDAVDAQMHGFVNTTETSVPTFNDTTFTVTLADAGAGWSYWRDGIKYTISGNKTVTFAGTPPTAGKYYVYIDDGIGTLSYGNTAWTLLDSKVPVAAICFNNALTPKYCLQDERHTTAFNKTDHSYEHLTYGTRFQSGGAISGQTINGTTDAANTYALSEAIIWDEDRKHTLAALSDGGTYHIEYRSGAANWLWLEQAIPFRYTASGYIQWDNAGTMTEADPNKWLTTYILATNTEGSPRFAIIHGQAQYNNLAAAQASKFSGLTLTGLQFAEVVAMWQIVWVTSPSLSTLGKCQLAAAPVRITTSLVAAATAPGLGTMSTQNADNVNITGGLINPTATKATPVDADFIVVGDSAATLANSMAKTTWAQMKATLKAYWDTIYPALAHTHAGTTQGSKLAQANTHESPDTDAATSSLHHTIGTTATTAAAGNHAHAQDAVSGLLTLSAPTADNSAGAVSVKDSGTVGEAVAFPNLLYLKSDGKWWLADADAATSMPGLRMALESKNADETCSMLIMGRVRDDDWNWTVAGLIYADTTPGALTQTAPSGTGDQLQILGIATSADTMIFTPSPDMAEIA